MEEPREIKSEPLEVQSVCLQPLESVRESFQIKSEPTEVQSTCSLQLPEYAGVSSSIKNEPMECEMNSQQELRVLLATGSSELSTFDSSQMDNATNILDMHVSELVRDQIRVGLSNIDPETLKALKELQNHWENLMTTTDNGRNDDHACQILERSGGQIALSEDEMDFTETSLVLDKFTSSHDLISYAVEGSNPVKGNQCDFKRTDSNRVSSLMNCNPRVSTVLKTLLQTLEPSEDTPLLILSTKAQKNGAISSIKCVEFDGAPLFFIGGTSIVNEITIGEDADLHNNETDGSNLVRYLGSQHGLNNSDVSDLEHLRTNGDYPLLNVNQGSKNVDTHNDFEQNDPNNSIIVADTNLESDVSLSMDVTDASGTENNADENYMDASANIDGVKNDHSYTRTTNASPPLRSYMKPIGSESHPYRSYMKTLKPPKGRLIDLEHNYSEYSKGISMSSYIRDKNNDLFSNNDINQDTDYSLPVGINYSCAMEEVKHSHTNEETFDTDKEPANSEYDLHSCRRQYKIHSRICGVQEMANLKSENNCRSELKLREKSHCIYIDRSKEGKKTLTVSCGYCLKIFTDLPDFLKHLNSTCTSKQPGNLNYLLIDRSDPYKNSIQGVPEIYLLWQYHTCQEKILRKNGRNFAFKTQKILEKIPNLEQLACKCKAKIGKSLLVFPSNTDKTNAGEICLLNKEKKISTADNIRLEHHILVKSGNEGAVFTCGICYVVFHSLPQFSSHISSKTCEDNAKNIPFCMTSRNSKFLWRCEFANSSQLGSQSTVYMCRHCIRTFDNYTSCIKHGEQLCGFVGKNIPNIEYAMLKRCNKCKRKEIKLSDRTDAMAGLVAQFEVIYKRLHKEFDICDRTNIKYPCNPLHKSHPQIKLMAFEIDMTNETSETEMDGSSAHVDTPTDKILSSDIAGDSFKLNEGTDDIADTPTDKILNSDIAGDSYKLSEGTDDLELDYETGIMSKVETVVLPVPGPAVQKFVRKVQMGTTCLEEKCNCEPRYAYHAINKTSKTYRCGYCNEKLLGQETFLNHVSKCTVTNENLILPAFCHGNKCPYICGLCTSTYARLCEVVSHMNLCAKAFPYICSDRIFGSLKHKFLPYCVAHNKHARNPECSSRDQCFALYLDILIKWNPEAYCKCKRVKRTNKKAWNGTIQEKQLTETSESLSSNNNRNTDHQLSDPGEVLQSVSHGKKEFHKIRKRKLYTCKFCGAKFNNRTALHIHRDIHYSQSRICYFCGKVCISLKAMTTHMRNVHFVNVRGKQQPPVKTPGNTKHKQSDPCQVVESESGGMKTIGKKQKRKLLYTCKFCGAKFNSRTAFHVHRDIHFNQSRICYFCGKVCISQKKITQHLRRVHRVNCRGEQQPPVKTTIYKGNKQRAGQSQCHLCGNVFKMRECLRYHFKFACKSNALFK